jgi:hypothetical protein
MQYEISPKLPYRPKVICLCGSTRFYKEYVQANYDFTLSGAIVLSVGFFGHALNEIHGETVGITPAQKGFLDELHKRKIDFADEVFVINVGGYVGESTRSEIEYARVHGKPVIYLEALRTPSHKDDDVPDYVSVPEDSVTNEARSAT